MARRSSSFDIRKAAMAAFRTAWDGTSGPAIPFDFRMSHTLDRHVREFVNLGDVALSRG
jgi:hypothetical protein